MDIIDANDTENLIGLPVESITYSRDENGKQWLRVVLEDGRAYVSHSKFFEKGEAFITRKLTEDYTVETQVWVYREKPEKLDFKTETPFWHALTITHREVGENVNYMQITEDVIGVDVRVYDLND